MAKSLPYFKWYPADAETDSKYRAMDDAERGFYLSCLNYAWINSGLPADPIERARVLGRTKREADKRWLRVGKCFAPRDGFADQLINPRQERERSEAISKSEKAAKSVRTRYEKPTNVDTNDLLGRRANEPLRALAGAVSDSVSEEKTKEARILVCGRGLDDWAEGLYARHPKKKNRGLVEGVLLEIATNWEIRAARAKVKDCNSLFSLIDTVHASLCTSEDWTKNRGNFCPKLDEWLDDDGYTVTDVTRPEPPEETEAERRARDAVDRAKIAARGVRPIA